MNYVKDICIHIFQILAKPYSPRAKIISPFVLRIEIEFLLMENKSIREVTKKMTKNFTHCASYGGGVSKFWCVNLKKMLF